MLKIKGLNYERKEIDILIRVEDIVGAREELQEPTNLYDDNHNLVSSVPNESAYLVFLNNGARILVSKSTYDKLIAKLAPETL